MHIVVFYWSTFSTINFRVRDTEKGRPHKLLEIMLYTQTTI